MSMFIFAAGALIVTMAITLVRLYLGPGMYDRVMSANMFGTKMVLMIAVLGFLTGRPDFLDIALAYALINFISTIAILKFFRYWSVHHRTVQQPDTSANGVQ